MVLAPLLLTPSPFPFMAIKRPFQTIFSVYKQVYQHCSYTVPHRQGIHLSQVTCQHSPRPSLKLSPAFCSLGRELFAASLLKGVSGTHENNARPLAPLSAMGTLAPQAQGPSSPAGSEVVPEQRALMVARGERIPSKHFR